MKAGLKSYYQPTPRNLRKLGDALLGISTFITASAIASQHAILAYISLGIGALGKFLTNFFEDGTNQ